MKESFIILATVALSGVYGLHSHSHSHLKRDAGWDIGQTVQTSSGPVSGHAASNAAQVSEYLGIPFAQAPTGHLRFAAPERFIGTTPVEASQFGPSCPIQNSPPMTISSIQAANITSVGISVLEALGNPNAVYSEDCLYLNVWTKPQTGEAKKAVMVWIYGGGFNSGSSSVPLYNGANLVDQEDVVVVSFNYRTSILGFPGNPVGPQNVAFLDQRLAMEWVRDNIANFGGDPSRITLFGQSAGGASVDFYSYAWNSDPIATGFISESGTVFSWGLPYTQAESSGYWFNVSATLGCGDASSNATQVLECMRIKNYTDILNAVPAQTQIETSTLSVFGPTIDNKVVFSNYAKRAPAQVPLLIGNTNYEAGLFRISFATQGAFFPDRFWDYFNLQEFTCPAGIRANASVVAKNPTWRYRYFGVFPDLAISPEAGAWHASEVPLLFDTVPLGAGATPQETSIASYMRGAWATFAKDPAKGLLTYEEGWPLYNENGETLIRLAYNNITGANLAQPSLYDSPCVYINVSSTDASAYLNGPSATSSESHGAGHTESASARAAIVSTTLLLAWFFATVLEIVAY